MLGPICPHCHACMRFYPEFSLEYKWKKCPTCGFTRKVIKMKQYITLEQYLTASGTYPERLIDKDLTPELLGNAKQLLDKVNKLLSEINYSPEIKVSSGYRPAAVNAGIGNAAKKSYHMRCMAVDLLDNSTQDLANLIAANPELLRKYELFLESPNSTKGKNTNWVHLDFGTRTDRPSRIFIP